MSKIKSCEIEQILVSPTIYLCVTFFVTTRIIPWIDETIYVILLEVKLTEHIFYSDSFDQV